VRAHGEDCAVNTIEDLMATLKHELRGPLFPLVTGIELLRLQGCNSPENTKTLAMMERQIKRITAVMDELLKGN
jgi:signal transduction histidine kinase